MTCQDVIVNLFDVLMELFDTNKAVFKLLLLARHKIKHLYNADEIKNVCKTFCATNAEGISNRDITIFKNTEFYNVIDMVWNELSPENRNLIWKWAITITHHCEIE
jgi:hypothetical protein